MRWVREGAMYAGRLTATVVTFFAAALCFGLQASAENRALLIGASSYPAHVSSLEGPANDVRAVRIAANQFLEL